MDKNTKYCWLNIETGEFSRSWGEETHKTVEEDLLASAKESPQWKLIKFQCLSDKNFEFTEHMKLR